MPDEAILRIILEDASASSGSAAPSTSTSASADLARITAGLERRIDNLAQAFRAGAGNASQAAGTRAGGGVDADISRKISDSMREMGESFRRSVSPITDVLSGMRQSGSAGGRGGGTQGSTAGLAEEIKKVASQLQLANLSTAQGSNNAIVGALASLREMLRPITTEARKREIAAQKAQQVSETPLRIQPGGPEYAQESPIDVAAARPDELIKNFIQHGAADLPLEQAEAPFWTGAEGPLAIRNAEAARGEKEAERLAREEARKTGAKANEARRLAASRKRFGMLGAASKADVARAQREAEEEEEEYARTAREEFRSRIDEEPDATEPRARRKRGLLERLIPSRYTQSDVLHRPVGTEEEQQQRRRIEKLRREKQAEDKAAAGATASAAVAAPDTTDTATYSLVDDTTATKPSGDEDLTARSTMHPMGEIEKEARKQREGTILPQRIRKPRIRKDEKLQSKWGGSQEPPDEGTPPEPPSTPPDEPPAGLGSAEAETPPEPAEVTASEPGEQVEQPFSIKEEEAAPEPVKKDRSEMTPDELKADRSRAGKLGAANRKLREAAEAAAEAAAAEAAAAEVAPTEEESAFELTEAAEAAAAEVAPTEEDDGIDLEPAPAEVAPTEEPTAAEEEGYYARQKRELEARLAYGRATHEEFKKKQEAERKPTRKEINEKAKQKIEAEKAKQREKEKAEAAERAEIAGIAAEAAALPELPTEDVESAIEEMLLAGEEPLEKIEYTPEPTKPVEKKKQPRKGNNRIVSYAQLKLLIDAKILPEGTHRKPPRISWAEYDKYIEQGGMEFAQGGTVPGAPQGTDTVPAWLTPGEYIVKADAAAANKPALEDMNRGQHFAKGGEAVASDVRETVGVFSGAASMAVNPNSDPSDSLSKMGSAVSGVGEKLAMVNPALGSMVMMAGEAGKAFAGLMQAIDKTAEKYGEFSPEIAQAQAMAEVQQTTGDIKRAQESGGELAKYVEAQSDLQQKFEDIKVKLLTQIVSAVTPIIEILGAILPSSEGIGEAISILTLPLKIIATAAGEMVGIQRDDRTRDIVDPTEYILNERKSMDSSPTPTSTE